MTWLLESARAPLLMAVGQVVCALFFLWDSEYSAGVSRARRLAMALGLLGYNTAVQTFLRVSISGNPLAPMIPYILMTLTGYTLFSLLYAGLPPRISLLAGLLFLTADNSAWSLINSISRMIWNRNFLYTGGKAERLIAALALWLVELAILAIVRRHLPPMHSVSLSRSTLLLIALAAVPFLTIRWFSSQLPAENAKTFQFLITLCFLWQLVLLVGSVARESSERERQLRRVLAAQQQQFDFKLQSIEAVNRKYHDMKNLLLYLEKGQRDAPELRTLLQEMAPFEALVSTGNEAVDIILTEKLTQCQQEDICCVPYVDGRMLSFVSPLDLCTIFGNALDNAIESCRAIPAPENRHISVKTNLRGAGLPQHVRRSARAGGRHAREHQAGPRKPRIRPQEHPPRHLQIRRNGALRRRGAGVRADPRAPRAGSGGYGELAALNPALPLNMASESVTINWKHCMPANPSIHTSIHKG